MAAVEKLIKALETLRVFQSTISAEDAAAKTKKDAALSKKDKIASCHTIADCVTSQNIGVTTDFPKFLGIAIETLITMCDDADVDVRLVADECLNKLIKVQMKSGVGRLQLELYKEIKKNGPSRCVRAALWRFAELAYLILPQKCRPYIVNLMPYLLRISQRPEEMLQETLSAAMAKMCPVLAGFMNDMETKMLLKAFISNLKSDSVTTRRTAAQCLTLICQYSHKPAMFVVWTLKLLLDTVRLQPSNEATEAGKPKSDAVGESVQTVLGVLLSVRYLMPLLDTTSDSSRRKRPVVVSGKVVEPAVHVDLALTVKVLELVLCYRKHADHNVTTAALEVLHHLLKHAPLSLRKALVQQGVLSAIMNSRSPGHRRLPSASDDLTIQDADDTKYDVSVSDEQGVDLNQTCEVSQTEVYNLAAPGEQQASALIGYQKTSTVGEDTDDDEDNGIFEMEGTSTSASLLGSSMITADSEYSSIDVGTDIVAEENLSTSGSHEALSSHTVDHDHVSAMEQNFSVSCDLDDAFRQLTIEPTEAAVQTSDVGGATVKQRQGDIGTLVDVTDVPAVYLVRLLCSEFLLAGYQCVLLPDRTVRVSVKALALQCIACLVDICPRAFIGKLHRASCEPVELQDISDIVQFTNHPDPQLKGNSAVVIGHFIRAVLGEGHGNWNAWLAANGATAGDKCSLVELMSHLVGLLSDDSAIAIRLALSALRLCLPAVFSSHHNVEALRALLAVFKLKNNSYWLVKVALLELLSDIDYKEVVYLESLGLALFSNSQHHFLSQLDIQQRMLVDVMLKLLGDEDQRVRNAAASAFCRVIPNLYYTSDNTVNDDPVSVKALIHISANLDTVYEQSKLNGLRTSMQAVKPFDDILPTDLPLSSLDASLSRVITQVVQTLVQSTSRYIMLGCCHTLSQLCESYSVIKHAGVWGCSLLSSAPLSVPISARKITRSQSGGSANSSTSGADDQATKYGVSGGGHLGLILSLLTSSPVSLDLNAHVDLLQLAGSLFAGAAYRCMRSSEDIVGVSADEQRWPALSDRLLAVMADQLITHLFRLLNIFFHIIEEVSPGPPVTKTTLPSLPNAPSLSPIRRKALKSGGKDDNTPPQSTPAKDKSSGRAPSKDSSGKETEANKDSKNRKEGLGLFYTLPHYMKLYEVLKGAFANYKITLESNSAADKFLQVLKMALQAVAQLLEAACLTDIGKQADEILGYLGATIGPEPTETILCVQQLLKAIFGSNLAGEWDANVLAPASPKNPSSSLKNSSASRMSTRPAAMSNVKSGIYHVCLNQPYVQFTQSLANVTNKPGTALNSAAGSLAANEHDESSGLLGWLKKRTEKSTPSNAKQHSKPGSASVDKTSVASYIRLFEPLVIKSLKQYTVTSQVALQQRVLDLLAQLVQLRVNYCLLDSDQIFIGYVIKQFEYIEEGQMRSSDQLIPHIFNFFVLLSYERYPTKTIMQIPKIIQLCDGIMASGQDPATHAIPALQCIVYDLFIFRVAQKVNLSKDLETQQEVVISMLLRLLQYCEVLDLLVVVLHQCHKDSEDRWKRLSRQVVDLLLPMLAQLQVNVDGQAGLNVVHRLVQSVAPSVFRPIDILLKVLFSKPPKLNAEVDVQRWVALVLISLRVILTQSKEEAVLGRLQQLGLNLCLVDCLPPSCDPTMLADVRDSSSAEEIFASFLLQVISLVASELSSCAFHWLSPSMESSSFEFLAVELSHLLLYIMHMFQSGACRRIAVATMSLLHQRGSSATVDHINSLFRVIGARWPTLMVQWSNILILLNYGNQAFWSDLLKTPQTFSGSINSFPSIQDGIITTGTIRCLSINSEIVRRGSLILFCDYVCENLSDAEHITWLIINHVFDLIFLLTEPPVQDFMSAIHRNSSSSGLFVQAINSKSEYISKLSPVLTQRTLQCLSGVHMAQSGALVSLLVEYYLDTHHLALSRIADSLACQRVELLIADCGEDGSNQASIEDIDKMLQVMSNLQLFDRHSRLATLLNKLKKTLLCEVPPVPVLSVVDGACQISLTSGKIADVNLDKEWFISLVSELCCRPKVEANHCAQLLQHLDYTSILGVIMHKNCHLSVLSECILLGAQRVVRCHETQSPSSPGGPSRQTDSVEPGASDPLLRAAELTLLRRINNIINSLPVPHQVLHWQAGKDGSQYQEHLNEMAIDSNSFDSVVHLTGALHSYLTCLDKLPCRRDIPSESLRDVARFATFSLEIIYCMMSHDRLVSSNHLLTTLRCYGDVVYNRHLCQLLSERDHTTLVCSAIMTVHIIVYSLLVVPGDKLVNLPDHESQDDLPNSSFDDCHHAIRACDQISELIDCLSSAFNSQSRQLISLPLYLVESLNSMITGLARLPLVNSYARTPTAVWKLGWMPSPAGDMRTKLPPLPLEYLREKDILSDFIRRVNIIGWTSRQQFEETWMSLLGVLNPLPMDNSSAALSQDELSERAQCQVLAIGGITALLVQTMLCPQCGSPGNSTFEYRPRNKPLAFFVSKYGQRLADVRTIIDTELMQTLELRSESQSFKNRNLLLDNVERLKGFSKDFYQLAQLSTESLWQGLGLLASNINSPSTDSTASLSDTPTFELSDNSAGRSPSINQTFSFGAVTSDPLRSVQRCELDINSCLQLLLDVYGNTILTSARAPIAVLNEAIRSIVVLSDVFNDKLQFDWMLTTLLDVYKSHPAEDELVMQYLVVGVSKAAAVVGVDAPMGDRVLKIVDSCLKSTHLPTKISTLYGCLYLLETGGFASLVPMLTDYLLRSLTSITPLTIHSQQHALVMWSVAFYIAESRANDIKETDYTSKLLQLSISVMSASEESTSIAVYLAVMHSLERLVLSDCTSDKPQLESRTVDAIVKLSIDRLCQPNPQRSLAALALFVSCMYSGLAGNESNVDVNGTATDSILIKNTLHNPEGLIVAMERVMVLFDRIRKGFPYEARVITRILPAFLTDFFPPQDIMSKIISEFLSSQQPHPELMANVLFKVFESLIHAKQDRLVHNWVILSLSNFTQRTPIAMAVWSLTCFFISASCNEWLRALMPLALSRVGRLQQIDSQLFYIAARDFYLQLSYDQSHQQAFQLTFQAVAQQDNPYAALLTFCDVNR